MSKLIKTLFLDLRIFFESYFQIPVLISLFITILTVLILLIKKQHCKNKITYYMKKVFISFIINFYFSELFYTTLIYRIGMKTEPLADVFGEWSVYDGETIMYINPKPILNILLFLPICFAVFYILKSFLNKTFTNKKIILLTLIISFFTSLAIELIQLIFCIGTFQLSDLTYNTLGGLIGAIIYITVKGIINKKSTG